ncbi:MAG: 50S ribosomal protein L4 [Pseudomonadota bacterium]|nr:50S ribosomal protein L4 [Pseudomonadota bacterium]
MATATVYDWQKDKSGTVELPDEVFGVPWRADIVQSVVRWQLASRRSGTHDTKTRADVSGGGKKPYKQKGTGNARRGSQRSPLIRGGAVVFGPSPRDYGYTLPKKVKKLGLRIALSRLLKDGKLFIVKTLESKDGKTSEIAKRLKKFGVEKAILIGGEADAMVGRAARNLPSFKYYTSAGLNVYDLLKYETLIMSKDAVDSIVKRCTVGGAK